MIKSRKFMVGLNLDTESFVLLPKPETCTGKLKGVSFDESLEMHVVNENDFQEIVKAYQITDTRDPYYEDMAEPRDEVADWYFIDRCYDYASAKGDEFVISDLGYGLIRNYLATNGVSDKAMVEQIPSLVNEYKEVEPHALLQQVGLYNADTDTKNEKQLLSDAIAYINSKDHLVFCDDYPLYDDPFVLYSEEVAVAG